MKQRLVSAMFLLPLLILLVIKGIPLYIGGVILMCIALHEFYCAFENLDIHPVKELGYIYSVILLFGNIYQWRSETFSLLLFVVFMVGMIYILTQKRNVLEISITFSGIMYICFCFNYIINTIDYIDAGNIYVWLIFIIAFITDTGAYFVGKNFGKKKLIPNISPNKTVEGSLGGIVCCVLFSLIFALIFKLDIGKVLVLSVFGSVFGQIGDLLASSIKRYVGIKDFGKLIPGHGGVLDRFDSVLLVAPYVYLVLLYFQHKL